LWRGKKIKRRREKKVEKIGEPYRKPPHNVRWLKTTGRKDDEQKKDLSVRGGERTERNGTKKKRRTMSDTWRGKELVAEQKGGGRGGSDGHLNRRRVMPKA